MQKTIFPICLDAPYFLSAENHILAASLQITLSERSHIPFLTDETKGYCIHIKTNGCLELYSLSKPKIRISADFSSGDFLYRLKTSGKNQPLAKAIGISKGISSVLDATGGLGYDAMILASLGLNVTICERQPLIALLLEQGIEQAKNRFEFAHRIDLKMQDASDYLNLSDTIPQAIYLDPMYPSKQKSSLPNKRMQILEDLIGADFDQSDLFDLAMQKASDRVVIKRPKAAHAFKTPTHSFLGSTTRYDLYKTFQPSMAGSEGFESNSP